MRLRFLLLLAVLAAPVQAKDIPYEVGQTNRVQRTYQTSTVSDDMMSQSQSSGSSVWLETVISIDASGTVLEYDIALEEGEDRKAVYWQYPARVHVANDGVITLLNRAEMEKRRDGWLNLAEIPAEDCGELYVNLFTTRINCDPDDTIKFIESLDWTPEQLEHGAMLKADKALADAPLQKVQDENAEETYLARFTLDPDALREERAEEQVLLGEIAMKANILNPEGQPFTGKATFEEALADQQKTEITGNLLVTLQVDGMGHVFRRTEEMYTEAVTEDGKREFHCSTQVMERLPQ